MQKESEYEKYDTKIEPFDWRYSAAIVGLHKYFNYFGEEGTDFEVTDDAIYFSRSDITEEKYLRFVENYYAGDFHHRNLEQMMHREEYTNEQKKMANDWMRGNSVLKKKFGKMQFDGTNQEEIRNVIQENRMTFIKETFRNKSNMYANYANTSQLMEEGKSCCRLLGYYVDGGRKSKSIAYNFDVNTFVAQDDKIFDFIPFAFSGDIESFFINDSFSVRQLIKTNTNFEHYIRKDASETESRSKNARRILFKSIQNTSEFLDYDVEVIVKNRKNAFFETMYIRKESIRVLKELKKLEDLSKAKIYDTFCFSLKMNDNHYLDIQKEVIKCILNLTRTDYLIELFLKQNSEYLVSLLIDVNWLICGGGEEMKKSMNVAYGCAKAVAENLPENKRESYRQKLTSAIIFRDYDRFCQILLQLSNYTEISFDFAYDLFEDFENNKDTAYTFVNALTKKREKKQEEK